MYALRERRVHVTQEDFEMAVTKVGHLCSKTFTEWFSPNIQILRATVVDVLISVVLNLDNC